MKWLIHLFKGLKLYIKLENEGLSDEEVHQLVKHVIGFNMTKPFLLRADWVISDTLSERVAQVHN